MTAAETICYERAVLTVRKAGEILRNQRRFLPRKNWLEKMLDFLERLWA